MQQQSKCGPDVRSKPQKEDKHSGLVIAQSSSATFSQLINHCVGHTTDLVDARKVSDHEVLHEAFSSHYGTILLSYAEQVFAT
jgi:hypothetical protein